LTSGTFDDALNPTVFAGFLETPWDRPAFVELAAALRGPISTVRVRDGRGRPVADARVRIGDESAQAILRTRTDGRAMWLHGFDGARARGTTVRVAAHGDEATAELRAAGGEVVVELPNARGDLPVALDIALVVDITGSMSDELEYLKVELREVASAVARDFPRVDQRFALVAYRDHGDAFVTRVEDFGDLDDFLAPLGAQVAAGGGDLPESMHEALRATTRLRWRTGNVARVVFLVADAPPHADELEPALHAGDQLRRRAIAIYAVAASGVDPEAELLMRALALMSGAQYVFLTDDSGVGDPHAEPHVPCYEVEPLVRTMGRMVATELSGQRVDAAAPDVLRRVGRSEAGVCRG
jgi:hypothetical protein